MFDNVKGTKLNMMFRVYSEKEVIKKNLMNNGTFSHILYSFELNEV